MADGPPFVWAAIDNTNRIQGLYWTEEAARAAHPECVDYEEMPVGGADEPPWPTGQVRGFPGTAGAVDPATAIELCEDPECPQAWAYRDPPREHWHPLPHGPRVEVPICLLCGEPGRILCEEHR